MKNKGPEIGSRKGTQEKNHIKFLKSPWTAGCPWDTRPVSRQKCQFYSKQQEIPGTPAGRPLFVRPVSQGFFLFLCACFFPEENRRKFVLHHKVFPTPFGSWTSTPNIVDVHTEKSVFLRPWWWGDTFLTPGHPGVRIRNVRRKSGPKGLYVYDVFFLP